MRPPDRVFDLVDLPDPRALSRRARRGLAARGRPQATLTGEFGQLLEVATAYGIYLHYLAHFQAQEMAGGATAETPHQRALEAARAKTRFRHVSARRLENLFSRHRKVCAYVARRLRDRPEPS